MNTAIDSDSPSYQQHQNYRAIEVGFTLIELMVTIAVLAIIVSIAAPNISNQLANQRVKLTTATLQSALLEAKAESSIRRQALDLIYDNNGTSTGSISISSVFNYSYNAKSTIKSTVSMLTFMPSKQVSTEMIYTICDSNTNATSMQISVSKVANITTKQGGSCP